MRTRAITEPPPTQEFLRPEWPGRAMAALRRHIRLRLTTAPLITLITIPGRTIGAVGSLSMSAPAFITVLATTRAVSGFAADRSRPGRSISSIS